MGLADGWFRLPRVLSRKLQRKLLSNRKGKNSPHFNHRKIGQVGEREPVQTREADVCRVKTLTDAHLSTIAGSK